VPRNLFLAAAYLAAIGGALIGGALIGARCAVVSGVHGQRWCGLADLG
jgi:hypothetical protein